MRVNLRESRSKRKPKYMIPMRKKSQILKDENLVEFNILVYISLIPIFTQIYFTNIFFIKYYY